MIPSVIERTTGAKYPVSEGYVVSCLAKGAYAGTYPDVDHEFQIKARLAMGNPLDEDVVRRMIELQFKLMREDPQQLWRNPCAVQPGGEREYHVRRSSLDGRTNAVMFLITGNVEVLESTWLYVAATKNISWLAEHISDLEGAASCIEDNIDRFGRLWSDVYYEDQVIQDGRVCDAQAFAANGFQLLADLEDILNCREQAEYYRTLSQQLAEALIKPLPQGYWDPKKHRFINWVDRNGIAHDHLHLLSNILPVLFGYATPEQQEAVLHFIDANVEKFEMFPSFVAADIAAYTDSEIGSGGPYDLCATGRYWSWDAAFWSWRRDVSMLKRQLDMVAHQGEREDYIMSERYDMDHVYYIDGKDFHGAYYYYEYPCVFTWVLITEWLGIKYTLSADLYVAPRINKHGRITIEFSRFNLAYEYHEDFFILENLAENKRTFEVDLSALYSNVTHWNVEMTEGVFGHSNGDKVTLGPGARCRFTPA